MKKIKLSSIKYKINKIKSNRFKIRQKFLKYIKKKIKVNQHTMKDYMAVLGFLNYRYNLEKNKLIREKMMEKHQMMEKKNKYKHLYQKYTFLRVKRCYENASLDYLKTGQKPIELESLILEKKKDLIDVCEYLDYQFYTDNLLDHVKRDGTIDPVRLGKEIEETFNYDLDFCESKLKALQKIDFSELNFLKNFSYFLMNFQFSFNLIHDNFFQKSNHFTKFFLEELTESFEKMKESFEISDQINFFNFKMMIYDLYEIILESIKKLLNFIIFNYKHLDHLFSIYVLYNYLLKLQNEIVLSLKRFHFNYVTEAFYFSSFLMKGIFHSTNSLELLLNQKILCDFQTVNSNLKQPNHTLTSSNFKGAKRLYYFRVKPKKNTVMRTNLNLNRFKKYLLTTYKCKPNYDDIIKKQPHSLKLF